eukprot:g2604.t1
MGYEFGDCPAVAQLHNGSIVSWSQSLYADTPGGNSDQSYSNLQIASQWGDKFKTLRPTIVFPDKIWQGARKANMEIRLDDPTIWMDQRGYWHALAHNGDGPFPCGHNGALGKAYRDGNPSPIGCSAHLYSRDGVTWTMSPVAAHNASVQFQDGTSIDGFRERPKVLVTPEGQLTHIFNGIMLCGEMTYPGFPGDGHCVPHAEEFGFGPGGLGIDAPRYEDASWTMVVPLGHPKATSEEEGSWP